MPESFDIAAVASDAPLAFLAWMLARQLMAAERRLGEVISTHDKAMAALVRAVRELGARVSSLERRAAEEP